MNLAGKKVVFLGDSITEGVGTTAINGSHEGYRYTDLFAKNNALDKLQNFVGGNARRIYQLNTAPKKIVLEDTPGSVPAVYEGHGEHVVPMFAGENLAWSVVR